MERGRVRLSGTSSEVGSAYQTEVFRRMVYAGIADTANDGNSDSTPSAEVPASISAEHARHAAFKERVAPLRTGSGEAQIQDIALVDQDGTETDSLPFGSRCKVRVFYRVDSILPGRCALTLGVTDTTGRQVLHFNSTSKSIFLSSNARHVLSVVEFEFDNPLCPGEYGFIAGIGSFVKNPRNHGQFVTDAIVDHVVGGARFSVRFPEHDTNDDLWGVVHVSFSASNRTLD